MPEMYDKVKQSLVKQGVGTSTDDRAVKSRAAAIFIARGKGGTRSDRAKRLQADRKSSR